jgi:glycosyltransferase involved in cell wall biosynthesis
MKLISVVTPCYNEEANVEELYQQVKDVFTSLPQYRYEHIFIDNASQDQTVRMLRELAQRDQRVKVIVNARNFGHIRSPFYALLQATGDAAISLVADLQDPPALIKDFLQQWEDGYLVVWGVKESSEESGIMFSLRRLYYRVLRKLSDVELVENCSGFGLYDQRVIQQLRRIDDAYPYGRGLIAEIGFTSAKISYRQPLRKGGQTKNNFYTLFDMAMTGVTSFTKIPLRLATISGFLCAILSLLIGIVYLVYKLVYWGHFSAGTAPVMIGLFFIGSVQLFFLGIVGEYIGAIHTQVLHRPLVIEQERINFADDVDRSTVVGVASGCGGAERHG